MPRHFEQIPPKRLPKLLAPGDLGRIPVRRLHDERVFWEGIERTADMLRMMMVEFMLDDVLASPDGVDERVAPVRIGNVPRLLVIRSDYSEYTLAGLGLSQFIRRTELFDQHASQYGTAMHRSGMDNGVFDLVPAEQAVRLHLSPNVVKELIPAFEPGRPTAWYGDGVSVVRASQPADITTTTADAFRRESGGEELDESGLVTLIPHLTHAYLRPPTSEVGTSQ